MTAVDWIVDQMFKQGYFDGNKPLSITNLDHLQQQAKEMEKQQIVDAFNEGSDDGFYGFGDSNKEKYYNETYKQELTSQLPGINVNDVKPSNPQIVKDIF